MNGRPKLADIGLVVTSDATVSFVGTAGYIAPEGPVTTQADIYSLGKVLYEASTGKDRQCYPDPPTEVISEAESRAWGELNEVILKACQSLVRNRYGSAAELQDDLELVRGGKSVRRLRLLERRFRILVLAAAGLFAFGLGVYLVQRTRELARRAAEREKHVAIQQMQSIRLNSRWNGWSDNAWNIGAAVRSQLDRGLLDHLTGSLVGLDAHLLRRRTNFHAVSASFDPSGTKLLLGTPKGAPVIWNLDKDRLTQSSEGTGPAIFVPEGVLSASLGETSLLLCRANAGESNVREYRFSEEADPLHLRPFAARPVALSTDGTLVAAAGIFDDGKGATAVWHVESGRRLLSNRHIATALAFSSDNSLFAEARTDGSVIISGLPGGNELMRLKQQAATIHTMVFRRDPEFIGHSSDILHGWWLAAGDNGGKVTVWDLARQLPKANLRRSHYDVYELAFSPDGTLLASGGRHALRVWDVANEQSVLQIDNPDVVTGLAFSPDGRRLAVCAATWQEQNVNVWEVQNGRGLRTLFGLGSQVSKIYLSPDERLLAALSHDWRMALWELPHGHLRAILRVPPGRQTADNAAVAISPDGVKLAVVAGTNAMIWDLQTFHKLAEHSLPEALGNVMGFHPSGKLLLLRNEFDIDEKSKGGRRPVFRIHDLLGVEPLRPLVEIANVASRVLDAVAPLDATFFAVETTFFTKAGPRRQVKAFDGLTGAELWSITVTNKANYANLRLDPSGRLLCFNPKVGHGAEAFLVDTRSGGLINRIPGTVYGLGPGGAWRVVMGLPHLLGRGYAVVAVPSGTPLMGLGIDFEGNTVAPAIGKSGSLLAWANFDGTVIVCDLAAVRERLAKVGDAGDAEPQ